MNKNELIKFIANIFIECPENIVSPETAITPELSGLVMYDAPLVCTASANDEIFSTFTSEKIIGSHYMLPSEWLDCAKSVVSVFFPFTERVRTAERQAVSETSPEWLHGRIEGQNFINNFTRNLCSALEAQGVKACAPSLDERFHVIPGKFSSNWSERHAAFAAGLGTFGLSRGIITSKGMAGRLTSVIIDAEIEPDARKYERYDEYCIKCGVCIKRCPVKAISFEHGKNHVPCSERLNQTKKKYAPRYGCGKCQTAVPCENRNPSAKN